MGSEASKSTLANKLVQGFATVVVGIVVGVGAALPRSHDYNLVGIQSIAAGILLSIILAGCFTMLRFEAPRWRLALIASFAAVLTQHYWLYHTALRIREEALSRQPAAGLFRSEVSQLSFFDYMVAEASASMLGLWVLEACLLALAAVVMVEFVGRR